VIGIAGRSKSDQEGKTMEPASYAQIRRNPKFVELIRQRGRLARNLTIAILVIYLGFILLVAFAKDFLGIPISEGSVTTIGIPIGLFVIVSAFVLTGIYVRKANTAFDDLNNEILEEIR
jgi:uncharacterized membrane protein (DUF485 family)